MSLVGKVSALFVLLVGAAGCVSAQFNGPAPLAWRWSQPTSVPPGGNAVALGETLYVAVGSRVYAIDKSTGNQKWRYPAEPLDANFRAGVITFEGSIIAAADNKTIYALDAETGSSKWQYFHIDPIIGTPVLVGKYIVFVTAGKGMMAIDATDGKPLWKTSDGKEQPLRFFEPVYGGLGVYGSNVLFFNQLFEVYSMDVTTQKINWKQKFNFLAPGMRPVVYGDTLLVSTGDFLTAMSAATGRKLWDVNVKTQIASNAGVSPSGIVVTDSDGKVYGFSLTGRSLFQKPLDLRSIPVVDPLVQGDLAIIATSNGSINLLDLKTGEQKWSFVIHPSATIVAPSTGGRSDGAASSKPINFVTAASTPVVVGNSLLVMARDGSLLAFDKEMGVDLTPPFIKMVSPMPGDQVSGRDLIIAFTAEDEASGIDANSIKIEVDGTVLEHAINKDNILYVQFTQTGANKTLFDGRKTITVTANDWLGNSVSKRFSLTIDNSLRSSKPSSGSSTGSANPGTVQPPRPRTPGGSTVPPPPRGGGRRGNR